MQLPILIVLHQEHSTPGRVGYALQRLGYRLDVRRPRFGDALPQNMRDHAAAVIFGGPMSANDDDEFIRREIDWSTVSLKEDKPFLGICLGAQMFARALGARVFPHPEGQAEVGYYPIRPTSAGLALVSDWPEQVYQWHREQRRIGKGYFIGAIDRLAVKHARTGLDVELQLTFVQEQRAHKTGAENRAHDQDDPRLSTHARLLATWHGPRAGPA